MDVCCSTVTAAYLHSVCLSGWGLSIGKYCTIITLKHIYKQGEKSHWATMECKCSGSFNKTQRQMMIFISLVYMIIKLCAQAHFWFQTGTRLTFHNLLSAGVVHLLLGSVGLEYTVKHVRLSLSNTRKEASEYICILLFVCVHWITSKS